MRKTTYITYAKPSLFARFKRTVKNAHASAAKLFKRIKDTRFLMKTCRYKFKEAWQRASQII